MRTTVHHPSARRKPTREPAPSSPARLRFAHLVENLGGTRAAAEAIGCSRAYVGMLVTGDRTPGLRMAAKIANLSHGSIRIPASDWVRGEEG